MKKAILIVVSIFAALQAAVAQEVDFRLELSSDTVLLGNVVVARFVLDNAEGGDFQAPAFDGFDVVSGPNMTSSFSMINGEVSQQVAYAFFLRPRDIGNYYIEPAAIRVRDDVLETEPLLLIVLPNPDGILEDPEPFGRPFRFHFDGFDGIDGFDLPGQSDWLERFRELEEFGGLDGFDLRKLMPPVAPDSIPADPGPAKKKRKTTKI